MKKLLTISVAAYNMEKYLAECLDSLVVPEIIDDLEVFVIDDGGTDASLDIAGSYAARYPDTFIPVHKENGGYGTTLNYSIAHATGKYFKYLDGDDWFDKNGFIKLVSELKKTDADVVITTEYAMGPDRDSMKTCTLDGWHGEIKTDVKDVTIGERFNGMRVTYKTAALQHCNLSLPSHMLYTDNYYYTIPFAYMKDLLYVDCLLYCYRIGQNEQSTSRVSKIKHVREHMKVSEDLSAFCEQKILEHNENINYIRHRVALTYITTLRSILLQPVCNDTLEQLIQFESRIREICPSVYEQSRNFSFRTSKLLRLLTKTKYKAYWLLKLIPGGMPNYQ